MSDVLEATKPLEAAGLEAAAPPVEQPEIPEAYRVPIEIEGAAKTVLNLGAVPEAARMHLLRSAAKSYVTNRVATAQSLAKKANAPFDAYDAAMKHDPLQTHIAKPEGERKQVDVQEIIDSAMKALLDGEITKRGRSGGDPKAPKDPLDAAIHRSLTVELFNTRKAAHPDYKYFTAQKEIGQDVQAALEAIVQRGIAAGMDEKQAREWVDNRYVKPNRLILGLDKLPGKLKEIEFSPF